MTAEMTRPDMRRATRFDVTFPTIFDRPDGSEFASTIANISAHGFMLADEVGMHKGERVSLRLPIAGRIEGFVVWAHNGRTGFEFERIIPQTEFVQMIDILTGKV
ncbi:MAG: PilZ domain-containing protein [Parasphingorhabdus sp.]|nr:PilZ domain-containing protein [Parasphingorhabdus sp.]